MCCWWKYTLYIKYPNRISEVFYLKIIWEWKNMKLLYYMIGKWWLLKNVICLNKLIFNQAYIYNKKVINIFHRPIKAGKINQQNPTSEICPFLRKPKNRRNPSQHSICLYLNSSISTSDDQNAKTCKTICKKANLILIHMCRHAMIFSECFPHVNISVNHNSLSPFRSPQPRFSSVYLSHLQMESYLLWTD